MSARVLNALTAIVAITALVVALFSYREVQGIGAASPDALHSIAALLAEREGEVKALQGVPFAEGPNGMLQSYLIRLRRDGAAGSAEMKQRLDRLAANTIALETLLDLAAGRSNSPSFKAEASRFKAYSVAWRDRWNSAAELFMAGGNFPAADVPFPVLLSAAVQDELRVSR